MVDIERHQAPTEPPVCSWCLSRSRPRRMKEAYATNGLYNKTVDVVGGGSREKARKDKLRLCLAPRPTSTLGSDAPSLSCSFLSVAPPYTSNTSNET